MNRRSDEKPKLTDADRHKRFVEMAHQVEASNDLAAFEKALDNVVNHRPPTSPPRKGTPK